MKPTPCPSTDAEVRLALYEAKIIRITSEGQVTIAQAVREQAGLHPHSEVEFEVQANGDVLLRPMAHHAASLRADFERVRGSANAAQFTGMGTDEFMAFVRGWSKKCLTTMWRVSKMPGMGRNPLSPARWWTAASGSMRWLTNTPWCEWSLQQLERCGRAAALVINPLIWAEISPRFVRFADLEAALAGLPLVRQALPWDAAFLAGQAFKIYRQALGGKTSPMPDLCIGAHALVSGLQLLTREASRYRSYFPPLALVAP